MYSIGSFGTSSPSLINCILWANMAGSVSNSFYNLVANINISYSLVEEASCAALAVGINSTVNCTGTMIYAQDPQFVDADEVPADVLEKEKEILVAQAQDSGKPAEIIEKMVEGRIRKYLAEITLKGQNFVKDPDVTVAKLLKNNNADVLNFVRFEVGEGIEKGEDNFVEEVMSQARGN